MRLLALLALASCAPAPADESCPAPAATTRLRVTVIGDSTAQKWPIIMQRDHAEFYVSNYAVGGSTVTAVGNQWSIETALVEPPPDALAVVAGVNDLIAGDTPAVVFERLSRLIYVPATEAGVQVYVVPVLPTGVVPRADIVALDDLIRTAPELLVVDVFDEFEAHPEYYLPDGLHQTPVGLQRIADAVAETLR